jgi:hypothetical protein
VSRRLALLAALVTALGPAGLGCAQAPSAEEAASETVALEELQVLAPGARFTAVRELVLSGASLWVLDGSPPFVTRVTLEGGEVIAFGARGPGPGELMDPRSLLPSPGAPEGSVWVWDYGTGRVSRFDSAGVFLASEPMDEGGATRVRRDLEEVSYVEPFRVRSLGAELLASHFPGRVDRSSDLVTGSLVRTHHRLAPGPVLARFSYHAGPASGGPREWEALPLWDACDGVVVLWSPASGQLLWLDGQGQTLRGAAVEKSPGPITLMDVERYLRRMARLELGPDYEGAGIDFTAMAGARRDQFPQRRPLATGLRCASADVAWVRLFDTDPDPLGRSRTWLRVPASGPQDAVTFPPAFSPFVFTPQGALGVLEAPDGQRLARWHAPGTVAQAPDLASAFPNRRTSHAP